MAIRTIRTEDDIILRKKSREVLEINKNILCLIQDMKDTLREQRGLGIAAPQIGILKKIILALDNHNNILEIINPVILESKGTQKSKEGCLSVKNKTGNVYRPKKIIIKALDINGQEIIITGTKRLATVLSHEIDHLEGILFIDKLID